MFSLFPALSFLQINSSFKFTVREQLHVTEVRLQRFQGTNSKIMDETK